MFFFTVCCHILILLAESILAFNVALVDVTVSLSWSLRERVWPWKCNLIWWDLICHSLTPNSARLSAGIVTTKLRVSIFLGPTLSHYCEVIMGVVASQITSLTIVYSTVYSGADQRKHQSSTTLAFVWGIHRGLVNSPHKWAVMQKMFPFDDVIMLSYFIFSGFIDKFPEMWYKVLAYCGKCIPGVK